MEKKEEIHVEEQKGHFTLSSMMSFMRRSASKPIHERNKQTITNSAGENSSNQDVEGTKRSEKKKMASFVEDGDLEDDFIDSDEEKFENPMHMETAEQPDSPAAPTGDPHDDHDSLLSESTESDFPVNNANGAFQGMLGTISGDVKATQEKLNEQQRSSGGKWQDVVLLLARSCLERDWFRYCMTLLSSMCRGRNLATQRLIGRLVPADMVLDVLNGCVDSEIDKKMACEFLLSVFIEHDYVFATRALTSQQAVVLAVDEINFKPRIRAGKLFNQATRPQFEGMRSGQSLRMQFWKFLREQTVSMSLTGQERDVLNYYSELIAVIRTLLQLDFFADSTEYRRIEEVNMYVPIEKRKCCSLNCLSSCCSKKKTSNNKEFNIDIIEICLIQKIEEYMSHHRSNINAIKDGIMKYAESSTSGGSDPEMLSDIRSRLNRNQGKYLGLENYSLSARHFEIEFSNIYMIKLMYHMISVLTSLYEIKQLNRVKSVMAMIDKYGEDLRDRYGKVKKEMEEENEGDADNNFNTDNNQIVINLPTNLINELSMLFITPNVSYAKKYTQILLSTTVFRDRNLQSSVYSLLRLQISEKVDMKRILQSVSFVLHATESEVQRISLVFHHVILKCTEELSNTMLHCPSHVLESLEFCLESVRVLSYRPSKSYFPAEDETVKAVIEEEAKGKKRKKKALSIDAEAEELKNKSMQQFQSTLYYQKFNYFDPVVDGFLFFADVCRSLLKTLIQFLGNNYTGVPRPWQSLEEREKNLASKIFEYLSKIAASASNDVHSALLDYSYIILRYQDGVCPAAELLFDWMMKRSGSVAIDRLVSEPLLSVLMSGMQSMSKGLPARPQSVRIIIKILQSIHNVNSHLSLENHIVDLLVENILKNGGMSKYVVLSQSMENDPDESIELNLQLLSLLALLTKYYQDNLSLMDDVRSHFSTNICCNLLESTAPLQIKIPIIIMSIQLYEYKIVPTEDYILSDLNRILQILKSEESNMNLEKMMTSIVYFIHDGVVPVLLRSLLSCRYVDNISIIKLIQNRTKKIGHMDLTSYFEDVAISSMDKIRWIAGSHLGVALNADVSVGHVELVKYLDCVETIFEIMKIRQDAIATAYMDIFENVSDIIQVFGSTAYLYKISIPRDIRHSSLGRKFRNMLDYLLLSQHKRNVRVSVERINKEEIIGSFLGAIDNHITPKYVFHFHLTIILSFFSTASVSARIKLLLYKLI